MLNSTTLEDGNGTISVSDFLAQLSAEGTKVKGQSQPISSTPPLSPRPAGSALTSVFQIATLITTTYVRDLHELIQLITPGSGPGCLMATFDVQQRRDSDGRDLPSFWATLKIDGVQGVHQEWVDRGPYANKKLAKEGVAKMGLEWLKGYEKVRGRQAGRGGRGPLSVTSALSGAAQVNLVQEAEEEGLKGKDWVGKLNDYVQKHRLHPVYTIHSALLLSAFACTITIPELSSLAVSSPLSATKPTAFGSTSTFYRKKSTAKAAAARDAMLHIWSIDPAAQSASSPQPRNAILHALGPTSASASRVVDVVIPPDLEGASAPQLVSWLCPKLRLCSLEYVFESPTGVPNLVDAMGRVKRVKPGVGVDQLVEIGPVRNIFGKPVARGKVAELALYWMCSKESRRLGIRIVGLREEYYQQHEEDEEDDEDDEEMYAENGETGGQLRINSENLSIRESEIIVRDEEEDDTMSLA